MSITPIQRQQRLVERGRIRAGVKTANAMKYLTTWRLTSHDQNAIETAGNLWGGEVKPWKPNDNSPQQWEVITETDRLPIAAAPLHEPCSMWREQWKAGGCTHRCNEETVLLYGKNGIEEKPCVCDPSNRRCQFVLRFSVMLPDLPGLGVWRVDTKSEIAADTVPGALNILSARAANGEFIEAILRLVEREERKQTGTKRFVVPVIDLPTSMRELLDGMAGGPRLTIQAPPARELPAPPPPPLPADPTFEEHREEYVVEAAPVEAAPSTPFVGSHTVAPVRSNEDIAVVPSNVFFAKAKKLADEASIRKAVLEVRGIESTKGITEDEAERVYDLLRKPVDEIALDVFGPGVEVVKEDPHG